MMKLAIIFLPILFAVIWAAFIGLRINKVETIKVFIKKMVLSLYVRSTVNRI